MSPNFKRSVIVEEGKTLNMSCSATGNPQPQVEWRRDDGRTINVNGIESECVDLANPSKFILIKFALLYSISELHQRTVPEVHQHHTPSDGRLYMPCQQWHRPRGKCHIPCRGAL